MRIIAASEVSGSAASSDKALKAALGAHLDSPPRRVDRLILQALLGAALLREQVQANCGLYIAARHPARGTMGSLLEAVCLKGLQPKPFEFVNSVSNAAGFHVAQQLGIEGPNLFIGAGPHVWSQLLALAAVDLKEGAVAQALLVLCDEQTDFRVQAVLLERGEESMLTSSFEGLSAGIEIRRLALG